MKGDLDYRGWTIFFSDYSEQYIAYHDDSKTTYFGKTIKEIKAKVKRHVTRWGW